MDNSTETYLLSSIEQIKKYKALADRRLELLKKMPEFVWDDEQGAYFCPICGANSNHGHLADCELAKEIK